MKAKTFKYRYKEEEAFKVLKQRVGNYFNDNGITKYANGEMILKAILILITIFTSYCLILFGGYSPIWMLVLALVFGTTSIMLGFNIGHDAAHYAFSSNRKVNELLSNSLYLVGSSSYVWKIRHNLNHHANSNIPDYDWTTYAHHRILTGDSNKFIKFISRYPHIYTPVLYSFYFIFLTLYKDFEIFYSKKVGDAYQFKPSLSEQILFPISKVLYVIFIFVIPIIYIDIPWWYVVLGYLIMHAVTGFIFSLVAIPPHLPENPNFPEVDKEGYLNYSRFTHDVKTTVDFARKSRLMNWVFGEFNTHLIHHLFPNICHVHYVKLSHILKTTLEEYGYEYKETSLIGAITSHFKFLKSIRRC